jgi:hypothetical protein
MTNKFFRGLLSTNSVCCFPDYPRGSKQMLVHDMLSLPTLWSQSFVPSSCGSSIQALIEPQHKAVCKAIRKEISQVSTWRIEYRVMSWRPDSLFVVIWANRSPQKMYYFCWATGEVKLKREFQVRSQGRHDKENQVMYVSMHRNVYSCKVMVKWVRKWVLGSALEQQRICVYIVTPNNKALHTNMLHVELCSLRMCPLKFRYRE